MQEEPETTTRAASAHSSSNNNNSSYPPSELPPSLHLSFQLPPKAEAPSPVLPKRRGPKKQYKRGRNESQKQVEARIRLHEHRQRWLRQIQTPESGGDDADNSGGLGPDDDSGGGGDDDGGDYSPHEEPSPPATPLLPPQLSAVVAARHSSSSDDPATKKRHRRKESERLLAEAGATIKQEQGTTQLDESALASGWKTITKPKKGLAKGAAKDEEETVYVGPDGKEYRSLRLVKRIIDGTHYKKFDGDDDDEGHSGKTPAKRYRRHSGEPRDTRTDEAKSPVVSPLPAQAKCEPASQNSMLEVAQFLDALATAAVSQAPTSIDNGGRQRWTEAGTRAVKSDEVQGNAGARVNLGGRLLGTEAKEIEGSSSDSGTEEVRRRQQQKKHKRKRPPTSRTQATKRSHTETVSGAEENIQARAQAIIARSNQIATTPVEADLNRRRNDTTRGPQSSPGLTGSPLPPVHRPEETATSTTPAPPGPTQPTSAAAAADQNHEEHKVRLVMRQLLDHFSQHLQSSTGLPSSSSSSAANKQASHPRSGPSLLQPPSPAPFPHLPLLPRSGAPPELLTVAVPQRPTPSLGSVTLPSVSTVPRGSFPASSAAHEPPAGALPPLAALMIPSTTPLWSLAATSAPSTSGAFSAPGGLSAAATLLSSSLASPNPTRLPPSSGGGLALPSIAALLGDGIPAGLPPPVSRNAHTSNKE